MEEKFIYPDEYGVYRVIQDVNGKIPYNKYFKAYFNVSGYYTVDYIRKRERQGKIEWQ